MTVTHTITIDLTRREELSHIHVVQGDVNSRALALVLTEGGKPFSIPKGTAAAVRFRKKDGTGGVYSTMPDGSNAYSVSGNTATVLLAPQVLTCSGGVTVSVALTNGGSVLGVFALRLWVEPDPSKDTVESENYFSFNSLEEINAALAGFASAVTTLQADSEEFESQLALERERINQLTSLEEGSTTGDAELADIRVGYDAQSYETAGVAVRAQAQALADGLQTLEDKLINQRTEALVPVDNWDACYQKSDTSMWISDKLYPKGRVTGVSLRILGDTAQDFIVRFYLGNGDGTATKYKDVTGNGLGIISVDCDFEMGEDFYMGISAKNVAYARFADAPYFTRTDAADTVTLPSSTSTKFYHAYAVHMAPLLDNKAEVEEVVQISYDKIRDTSVYADVVALPNNRIFYIHNSLDYQAFGLPYGGYGTLLKYRPFPMQNATTGFTVYEYTVFQSGDIRKYFAYALNDQTAASLVWRRYSTVQSSRGIYNLGLAEQSIVFLGDSIVEGYGSSDYNGGAEGTSGHLIPNNVKTWYRNTGSLCWANQMIQYLTTIYPGVTACNNGVGGFTAQNVYDNLETLTLDDAGNRADVVILSVGTNNRNASDKVASIVTPLTKTIRWLQQRNIQPIILTNTPIMGITGYNNAQVIQSAIFRACEDAGVRCYDVLSQFLRYLWEHDTGLSQDTVMNDALHPNDLGYEIMFRIIRDLLRV